MALAPVATAAFAELDVQVYEGDGAVGIVVSELESGFDVSLDDNSTVIVRGDNVSSSSNDTGVVVGAPDSDNNTSVVDNNVTEVTNDNVTEIGGSDNSTVTNDTEGVITCITSPCGPFNDDNQTGSDNQTVTQVEIPHIGGVPIDFGTYNGTGTNITSSTDVINEVTGGNITDDNVVIGGNVTDSGTTVDTGNQTSVEDEIGDILNQNDCLSGDEFRQLIYLLSLFAH